MKGFDEVVGFHGHACPGLALGYMVARYVMEEFGARATDEELVAIVENNSCAVDAIQVVTGCTFGKGNLIFMDYGKQVYTFLNRPTGDAIRLSVIWEGIPESAEEKQMWQRYMSGDRSEDVLRVVHQRKAKKTEAILNAPFDQIFRVQRMILQPPPLAGIYPSVRCESCGEKVMETKARLREGKLLCIPCAEGYRR